MINLKKRFEDKVLKTDTCWSWVGSKTSSGYGLFYIGKVRHRAHRVAYSIFCGTLEPGMVIDHLCKNRLCVNPEHLEQVTQAENVRRGLAGKQNNHNLRKHACPYGHEYSRLNKYGHRVCGKCKSRQEMEYRRRRLDSHGKSL